MMSTPPPTIQKAQVVKTWDWVGAGGAGGVSVGDTTWGLGAGVPFVTTWSPFAAPAAAHWGP